MKRIQQVLFASMLALVISAAAYAGDIPGGRTATLTGDIPGGKTASMVPGDIPGGKSAVLIPDDTLEGFVMNSVIALIVNGIY